MSAINKLQVLVILIMTEIGCNSDDERSQNKWLVWPWTWDVQWLIESVPADMLFYHWLNVKDLSSSSSSSCTPPNLEWFLMLVRPTVLVPHVKGKYFDCHRQHLDRQCGQCDSVWPVQLWQSHITLSRHTVTTWSTRDTTETSSPLARSNLSPQYSLVGIVLMDLPASQALVTGYSHWLRTELVKACVLCIQRYFMFKVNWSKRDINLSFENSISYFILFLL